MCVYFCYAHQCSMCICMPMVHACVLCVHVCACKSVHVYALLPGVFMGIVHVCWCMYVCCVYTFAHIYTCVCLHAACMCLYTPLVYHRPRIPSFLRSPPLSAAASCGPSMAWSRNTWGGRSLCSRRRTLPRPTGSWPFSRGMNCTVSFLPR